VSSACVVGDPGQRAMIFDKTLAGVLKSQLRQWVKVHASDVGVGISGGHLSLDNVQLRAEALNSLSLPFQVHSGFAGRLRVDVPWSALSSSPITIYLEDVHIIAGRSSSASKSHVRNPSTGHLSDNESDESEAALEDKKKDRRKKKCSNTDSGSNASTGDSSLQGGGDQEKWHYNLAFRLAANVSIEINGFKLEYSDKKCHMALNFTSLKTTACNCAWDSAFVSLDDTSGVPFSIRRAIDLECLQFQVKAADGAVDSKEAFEKLFPVLAGLNLRVELFMCTGGDGEHRTAKAIEVDLELEEPCISLSARQLKWIQRIIADNERHLKRQREGRASRNSSEQSLGMHTMGNGKQGLLRKSSGGSRQNSTSSSGGAMTRLWSYIVGENGYSLEEDAAGLLGLDVEDDDAAIVDDPFILSQLLEQAGRAGGYTWKLRVRTPDIRAREELRRVKLQLKEEKKFREKFSDVKDIVAQAEERIREAEEEAGSLRERNAALKAELADLEKLVGEQNRNKDAIIRQMEAALSKAERHLQMLIQKGAVAPASNTANSSAPDDPPRQGRPRPSKGMPQPGGGDENRSNRRHSSTQSSVDGLQLV